MNLVDLHHKFLKMVFDITFDDNTCEKFLKENKLNPNFYSTEYKECAVTLLASCARENIYDILQHHSEGKLNLLVTDNTGLLPSQILAEENSHWRDPRVDKFIDRLFKDEYNQAKEHGIDLEPYWKEKIKIPTAPHYTLLPEKMTYDIDLSKLSQSGISNNMPEI
ncbi:MAG: hypothetical protein AAF549_09330 [Pseudomonadota bacterium]